MLNASSLRDFDFTYPLSDSRETCRKGGCRSLLGGKYRVVRLSCRVHTDWARTGRAAADKALRNMTGMVEEKVEGRISGFGK